MNNMKVLEGLEKLKYEALYNVAMYNKTKYGYYRYMIELIIENTMKYYGVNGLTEVLDFIHSETE